MTIVRKGYWGFVGLLYGALFVAGCANDVQPDLPDFANPSAVIISGYDGHAMEPFISADGRTLFFNNFGDTDGNADIHYAIKTATGSFDYKGLVAGINTTALEGVPSMDLAGNFYYTSTISYFDDLLTIYKGDYQNGRITNPIAIDQQLTLNTPGYLDMDACISPDGHFIYLAIAKFSGNSYPDESNLILAEKDGSGAFVKVENSAAILATINTEQLEYAPSISYDGLTLYFNRTNILQQPYTFSIMYASRKNINDAFGTPQVVPGITGVIVEGACISADNKDLYYHLKVNDRFKIYKISR